MNKKYEDMTMSQLWEVISEDLKGRSKSSLTNLIYALMSRNDMLHYIEFNSD